MKMLQDVLSSNWNGCTGDHKSVVVKIIVVPDKEKWLAATQIPLTVFVGLNDTAELPLELIPGQKGKNRFTIARNWVQDMNVFAEANGLESRFKVELIPDIGHSMSRLMPYSQEALLAQ